MSDPPKKFTFGFSKVVKKSLLVAPPPVSKEKKDNVQFIECMEANAIKLKEGEENNKEEAPLVIPIIGPRKSSTLSNGRSIAEIAEDFSDLGENVSEVKKEILDLPANTLEALAAREILQEGADTLKEAPESTLETLPKSDTQEKEKLQKESTLEDYDNIPVTQFGLAMLRGMGWKPDEGIGKNKKLVAVTAPQVRPKGMGLGADKMVLAAAAAAASKTESNKNEEELKMVKGAHVKVAAGMHKGNYALVEGFSDDSGRVVIKMAIGGNVVSVNEATIILVTKTEYAKNSKVLNAAKFEDFKKNEESGKNISKPIRRSPSPSRKGRHPSPSSSRALKKEGSRRDQYSSHQEKSWPTEPKVKKERNISRSKSRSPERQIKKKNSGRDRSRSPLNRRASPSFTEECRTNLSSTRHKRNSSESPNRNSKYRSPATRKSRSRDRSTSRERSYHQKHYSDSDSDSQSRKKKKKKHKERKRSYSRSVSRDRSRSPKARRKEKKHKKSRSKSPKSRKRR